MKKQVVLYNIFTSKYLMFIGEFSLTSNYEGAKIFNSEDLAVQFLKDNQEVLRNSFPSTWCTRTFYKI